MYKRQRRFRTWAWRRTRIRFCLDRREDVYKPQLRALLRASAFGNIRICLLYTSRKLYNYWGYNTVSFFSPNTSYAAGTEYNREGNELKNLIRVFNQHGIEVYLDEMCIRDRDSGTGSGGRGQI